MSQGKSSSLWKNENWWTSPYDFADQVMKNSNFAQHIELHDVTLRDGEQTPGVAFSKEDKIKIAAKLEDAHIQRIEAGMPLVSEEDKQAITEIAKNASFSKIFAFCRARRQDVDVALSCDVPAIVMEIPSLKQRLDVMGLTLERAAAQAADAIEYAKSHGLFVVYFLIDTTRSDFAAITTMVKAGESAHPDRLAVVDTAGAASPEGYSYLVNEIKKISKLPLEVHCHNPLGLGVANTLAGLREGAVAAHVALNGIGEGAGNVALEEVVLALLLVHGIDCGVDLKKLKEACDLVEKLSKIPIPVNKPVLGKNIFRRESGIVVERYYKSPEVAREMELFDPAWFAGETEIVLGKKSGKYSILYELRKRGVTGTDEQVSELLNRVKQRGIEQKTLVSEEEFDAMLTQVMGKKS